MFRVPNMARPKGAKNKIASPADLARRVRRKTRAGKLIQDAAFAVMTDPHSKPIEKLKAAEFLKETGWGLASRGGEEENKATQINVKIVYYARPERANKAATDKAPTATATNGAEPGVVCE
jgi:hypothetical protein